MAVVFTSDRIAVRQHLCNTLVTRAITRYSRSSVPVAGGAVGAGSHAITLLRVPNGINLLSHNKVPADS